MPAPTSPPNGHIDRIKAGARNITIQTEFFPSPSWRIEVKVYVDGALKKMDQVPLDGTPEAKLQEIVDERHRRMTEEITAKLRSQSEGR